jgi:hypothetical protein
MRRGPNKTNKEKQILENMKKAKLLSFLAIPFLLTGCAAQSAPRPVALTNAKSAVKGLAGGASNQVVIDAGGGGGGSSTSNYTSTGYPSFYGTESITSTLNTGTISAPSDSTRSYDSGVKVYGSGTSTSVGSTNAIKLNARSPFFDFSDVAWTAPSSITSVATIVLISGYKLEVYSGSYRCFIANAYIESDVAKLNKNGTITTATTSTSSGIVPSELGKISSSLSNGSYTVKVTVSFMWAEVNTTTGKMGIFESTGTTSGTLLIDATAPTVSMTSGGKTIANGGVANVAITFNVFDANPQYIYYKSPAMSSYMMVSYGSGATSYTGATNNGVHSFYAVDALGNKSETISATLDTICPSGQIYANGVAASTDSYTGSSFSYVASDSGTGVKACYYKGPSSSSYVQYSSGSIIPNNSGDGWYSFYSVDNAGNVSSTIRIFLETKDPTIKILRNGQVAFTDTIGEGGIKDTGLYFNEGDTIGFGYSSSSNVYSTTPFGVGPTVTLSASSYPNDSYTETFKSATGISKTYLFRIVRDKPYINVNGVRYESGASVVLNSDAHVEMKVDDVICGGTNKGTISGDYSGNYDVLESGDADLSAVSDEDKTFSISLSDAAGNESSFTVEIDKSPAKATWKSNGAVIANSGYTNHPACLEFDSSEATATFSKDGGEFASYASGSSLNEDGSYTVILIDDAGNKSEYRIVIDTVAPVGKIYSDNAAAQSGLVTSSSIYFTWDGDATCLLNGNAYEKNTLVDSEGVFRFVLSDKAGNSSEYLAEIDRTAPVGNEDGLNADGRYAVSKWWDCSFGEEAKSFVTYDSALEYAEQKEWAANVAELSLSNVSDFTETNLVADNGDPDNHDDEVRTGTYWSYKSKSNPDIKLYYFDRALLDDAVAFYSKKFVSEPNYYDGSNSPSNGDIWDTTWELDGVSAPIGNDYCLTNYGASEAFAIKRGTSEKIPLQYGLKLSEQLLETGVYDVTEVDIAGNSCTYPVIIDLDAPGLNVSFDTYGSGSSETTISKESLPVSGTYYLKSLSIGKILDGDRWSVVAVTKDGKTTRYSKGDDMPTISEGGEYGISVYDRLGNTLSFKVFISSSEESVVFEANADSTSVSIGIQMGESFETLTSVEIYRNGEKLSGVSTDKLNYTFDKDGLYKVVIKDNFGRTITKEYRFVKALPQGALTGVEDGGKTAKDVSFSYDPSKYYLEVYKDGELYRLDESGSLLLEANAETSGLYTYRLINKTDADNVKEYKFEIDTVSPDVSLNGVADGGTTNGSVGVSWEAGDVTEATYSFNGGEPVAFSSGTEFDKEGTYVITVKDDMGNATTKTFTVDKTVDYVVKTSDGKTIGGDATTSDDVIVTSNEDAKVTVIKDGEKYDYAFGDALSEEGTYLITVEDDFANKNSFTIVIDKTVDFSMNAADGGITNDPVTISSGEKETVVVTKDGSPYGYVAGQEITEEGSYTVVITDAYGNSKTVTFQIAGPEARTSIDYDLGDGVEVTKVTKDGKDIDFSGSHIGFTEDGTYVITYTKDGKEYSFTLVLDTTAPEATLNGVEDGGKVDGSVSIDGMSEEGTIEVYKDGVKIDYKIGEKLSDYGHYEVVVKDALGNARTYTFDLAFQMNGWAIALIAVGILAAVAVTVTIVVKRKRVFKK